jgi:hypothetical protein
MAKEKTVKKKAAKKAAPAKKKAAAKISKKAATAKKTKAPAKKSKIQIRSGVNRGANEAAPMRKGPGTGSAGQSGDIPTISGRGTDGHGPTFSISGNKRIPATGLVKDRCNVRANDNKVVRQHRRDGIRIDGAVHRRETRVHIVRAGARPSADRAAVHVEEAAAASADFSITGRTSIPANGCGSPRFLRWIPRSCFAACSLAGSISQHTEISDLAQEMFNRVDWQLALGRHADPAARMDAGNGFLQYRWDSYSEMMMMYLLGMGSSTHPLPRIAGMPGSARLRIRRDTIHRLVRAAFRPPIFAGVVRFSRQARSYADYFQNSVIATDVHRRFCLSLAKTVSGLQRRPVGYHRVGFGQGYEIWGGPPSTGPIDGTVVPCAAAGSLPFHPHRFHARAADDQERYGAGTWSHYGFVDAFNPLTNWYDSDVVGIDSGITMVMAENARTVLCGTPS